MTNGVWKKSKKFFQSHHFINGQVSFSKKKIITRNWNNVKKSFSIDFFDWILNNIINGYNSNDYHKLILIK